MIKASGGGGGKGMKIVHKEEEFETLFSTAKTEAQKYFGNDEVYIEKFFQNPRHIEVQFYLERIEQFIYTKETALYKEGIKN